MEPVTTPSKPKRWGLLIALALIAVGAFVVLEPSQIAMGTLAGDPFFEGRPARNWAAKLGGGPAERAAAETQLQQGGSKAVAVLGGIVRGISGTQNPEPRWIAAEILTKIGPDAAAAGPDLIMGLRDPDPALQAVCASGLNKIGVAAETAVPILIELLKTQHAVVAARALSTYRGAAASSLPQLVEMLQDQSLPAEVRWNAARTIGKIGPESLSALPVLIATITDKEWTIREHCAEAIGDIGPTAVEGLPVLIKALSDEDARVRRDAVRALGYLGVEAKKAVPEIKRLIKDPVERVRDAIIPALQQIAPKEVAAVEKQLVLEKAVLEKAKETKTEKPGEKKTTAPANAPK